MITDGRTVRIAISTHCKLKFKFFEGAYIFGILQILMKSIVFTPDSGNPVSIVLLQMCVCAPFSFLSSRVSSFRSMFENGGRGSRGWGVSWRPVGHPPSYLFQRRIIMLMTKTCGRYENMRIDANTVAGQRRKTSQKTLRRAS